MGARSAIYFAAAPRSALEAFGCGWLGRALDGAPLTQPAVDGIEAAWLITRSLLVPLEAAEIAKIERCMDQAGLTPETAYALVAQGAAGRLRRLFRRPQLRQGRAGIRRHDDVGLPPCESDDA